MNFNYVTLKFNYRISDNNLFFMVNITLFIDFTQFTVGTKKLHYADDTLRKNTNLFA